MPAATADVSSAFIATAFEQDDAETGQCQRRRVADQLPKLPKLSGFPGDAETDVLLHGHPAPAR
jgi:putative transposase